MASVDSNLSTRVCITWHTKLPVKFYKRRGCSFFKFMNHEWYLNFYYNAYLANKPDHYRVSIVNKNESVKFPPFRVSVHIESSDDDDEKGPLLYQKRKISKSNSTIWNVTERIFNSVFSGGDKPSDVILVCLFDLPDDCTLRTQETESKSVQTSSDIPLLEKDLKNTRNLSENSSLTYLELPYALENLSKDFGEILQKNVLSDVQLKSGDRTIPAHRAVLAARSEVFAAMFQHETAESSRGIIDIKDAEPTVLEVFLKFMYSGKIADNLPEDMISNLYAISDKYAVYSLRTICSNLMTSNVNEDNILKLLTLADDHSDIEFKDTLASFITKDDTLLKSKNWTTFAKEKPVLAIEIYGKFFSK